MIAFRSLQGKFTFYLAVLVVALTAVFGYQDIVRERKLLESMIGGKGRALVETLAIPVTNTLLYEELGLVEEGGMLDNYVEGLIAHESLGIVYAEVLDTKGSVIAHSDPSELGAARSDPEPLPSLLTWETRLRKSKILHDGQMISVLHIATPLTISSKRWGSLRVGVSLEPLRKRVLTAALRIVIFSLASVTCVVVAVALLFRAMTGPMKKLALAMDRVAAGASPDLSTDLRRDDEVGILRKSFASMLEKLRKAEEDRELTQKRLVFAEKMASIGKLTAAISHEINNPLSGLLHCVKAFKKRSLPERKKKEYLSLMEDGVHRIQKRVKDLLEYARPHDLRLVPANINQLVEKVLSFLDFPLKNAGISIETHLEDRVAAEMLIDSNQIEQVLMNVLLNALQAMENGGKLCVRTAFQNGVCRIEISDTGAGIPKEIQARLFELFFTTKENQGGTGLGLPISQRIVEFHGGELIIVSDEGRGTTVIIELPVINAQSHLAEEGL